LERSNNKWIIILVDGSNVAFFNPTQKGLGRFDNLLAFSSFLRDLNKKYSIQYEILVDASLKHKIDNEQGLESALNKGKIIQCPSRTEADYFILEYFKRHEENVIIISNDNFSQYNVSNLRQCRFAFILNEIILNPSIEKFCDILNDKNTGEQLIA